MPLGQVRACACPGRIARRVDVKLSVEEARLEADPAITIAYGAEVVALHGDAISKRFGPRRAPASSRNQNSRAVHYGGRGP